MAPRLPAGPPVSFFLLTQPNSDQWSFFPHALLFRSLGPRLCYYVCQMMAHATQKLAVTSGGGGVRFICRQWSWVSFRVARRVVYESIAPTGRPAALTLKTTL